MINVGDAMYFTTFPPALVIPFTVDDGSIVSLVILLVLVVRQLDAEVSQVRHLASHTSHVDTTLGGKGDCT